jgi:hypothetical protein
MAMMVSMAELRRANVAVRADEAVAIAQKLIHEPQHAAGTEPFGPPSLERVCIGDDGSVICRGCEATPGVAEIAILLEALLPEGAPGVPGALRYVIARALHEVDAPPFDSLDALSAALSRHEHGDRDVVLRRLAARAAGARAHADAGDERRRGRATPGDYRRLLREADEKLYRQQLALDAVVPAAALAQPPAPPRSSMRRRVLAAVVALLIGLLILASAEALRTESSAAALPAPAPVPQASTVPPVPADRPIEARTPPVERAQSAQRPRARVQPRTAPPRSNKTSSRLFPKLRVVDDFSKR